MDSTIEFNNKSVSLIENAEYNTAITHLTTALQTAQLHLVASEDQDGESDMETCLDACIIQNNTCESDSFMYDRPITIPSTMGQAQSNEAALNVSAIIMFNLAMAHHLQSLKDGNKSILKRAAKLYELAYNLQSEENIQGSSVLFEMAIIHNLGLVYMSMGDTDSARPCFEHLLSSLMCLVDSGDGEIVSKVGGDLFFRTTAHLIAWSGVAAAAA